MELNAFTSDQFVVWLEGKLQEHGVTKVVPDDARAGARVQAQYRGGIFEDHAHDRSKQPARHAAAADLPSDLRARMEEGLQTDPARSWDAVIAGSLAVSERLGPRIAARAMP